MSEHYDVIIAGGGFAGLCCAFNLKGKKVLVLETRKEIGRKHRGSQSSLYPYGERYEVDGNDIYFHKNKIRAHNAFMGRLTHMEFAAGEQKLIANAKNPSIVVDEGKIKGALEHRCREAGVDIITGAKVRSVETDGEHVSVYTEKKYDAQYLVGADGAHSQVIRHLPIKRRKIGSFAELEIEAECMDIPDEGFYAEFKNVTIGFYAQVYGDGYMLGAFQGLGMNGNRIDLKKYMDQAMQKMNVRGVTRQYGCFIPICLSAPSSYYKNILMAGDSVTSFSMATITGAMLMGLLAAEAILKKAQGVVNAFEEYDTKWRRDLQQASLDRMKYFFFLLRRLNEKRMGRLFKTLGGSDLASVGKGYYLKRIPGILRAFL
jgi:flavin-dependent dehydrogenase